MRGDAEVDSGAQKETTREDITEHDTKEEGEGDVGEETRVDFLVGGNFILVNNHLTDCRKFTFTEVGGDRELRINFTLNDVDVHLKVTRQFDAFIEELVLLLGGNPNETDQ